MEETRTPLTLAAKICMFLAGFSDFILGYAIYFVLYDTDREKAVWFRYGARTAIILIFAWVMIMLIGLLFGVATF